MSHSLTMSTTSTTVVLYNDVTYLDNITVWVKLETSNATWLVKSLDRAIKRKEKCF